MFLTEDDRQVTSETFWNSNCHLLPLSTDTQITKSSEDVGISLQMRYEPGRLERLMTITNFSKQEIRMLYQGFKSVRVMLLEWFRFNSSESLL